MDPQSTPPSPETTQEVYIRTLVVTDLVDSTRLVETLGDARANEINALHDRLARDLLIEFLGQEVDKTDGFLLLFERPIDAVLYALAYHEKLHLLSRRLGVEVEARVGIHLGEVFIRHNDPQDVRRGAKPVEVDGLAKPIAARAMSLARAGQTLVTRSVFDLARRAMVGSTRSGRELHWLAHGPYLFKGVEEALDIFEVGVEGLSPLLPPSSTEKARRARSGELTVTGERVLLPPEETARLWSSRKRVALLLTLIILALLGAWVGWFVGSRGSSSATAAAEIARPSVAVLGFKNLAAREDLDWLATALSEIFSTELAAGGELRLIAGESVARMKKELVLPDADTLAEDTLARVRRNLGTDFVLQGSYLALGEGAERTLRLQLRLQDTRESRLPSSVSNSGREADLLELVNRSAAELRQILGVGEVSQAAAAAVRASLSESREATRLYSEGLAALRSFRLLAAVEALQKAVAEDPSYAMAHAALSEAWDGLEHDEKAEESARKAFELAEDLGREAYLTIQGRYFEKAADWTRAIETYRVLAGYHPDNVDHGLKLIEAQRWAGQAADSLETLDRLRRLPSPLSDDPRLDLAEGRAARALTDHRRELAAARAAAAKGRAQEASLLVAEALLSEATALHRLGETAGVLEALEESRQLFADAGDRAGAARAMNMSANVFQTRGGLARAQALYEQAMEIYREIGARRLLSTVMNNASLVAMNRGELAKARSTLEESLEIVRQIGDSNREATRLENLGWIVFEQGLLDEAEARAAEALEAYRAIGARSGVAWSLLLEGEIAFARGRLAQARGRFEEALQISEEIRALHVSGNVLNGLGRLYLAMGDPLQALGWLDRAAWIHEDLGVTGTMARTQRTRALVLLSQGRFDETEGLARQAVSEFRREGRRDDELAAVAVLVEALIARGETAAARQALEIAEDSRQSSENPAASVRASLAEARLLDAEGRATEAKQRASAALQQAAEAGLGALTLEARLTLAEIELGLDGRAAQAALSALAAEAEGAGFLLIAERARAAVSVPSTP